MVGYTDSSDHYGDCYAGHDRYTTIAVSCTLESQLSPAPNEHPLADQLSECASDSCIAELLAQLHSRYVPEMQILDPTAIYMIGSGEASEAFACTDFDAACVPLGVNL